MTLSILANHATVAGGDTTPQANPPIRAFRPVPRNSIHAICETERVAKPLERARDARPMTNAQHNDQNGCVPNAI
ncbi:CtpF protein, partial [Mesorhizobium japonicum]